MSLDPKVAAFLQEVKISGAKTYESMTPEEARRLEALPPHYYRALEQVDHIEHRFIAGPTADLPIRIYYPLNSLHADNPHHNKQPALVFLHGSGWVVSNIATNDHFSRALANRTGCVVIAVNYQKAPEHKFPIPMDDCYAASEWVFANAATLGLDINRIGILGDSAGGNLAAAVTLKARDEKGPVFAYQILVYPAVKYGWDTPSAQTYAEGYLLQTASMQYYWHHYLRSKTDIHHPYCSPFDASSHKNLPPAFILCAEYDPLCDDGRYYAEKLAAYGVPVKFKLYKGVIHGFIKMLGLFDQADEFLDDIAAEIAIYHLNCATDYP